MKIRIDLPGGTARSKCLNGTHGRLRPRLDAAGLVPVAGPDDWTEPGERSGR